MRTSLPLAGPLASSVRPSDWHLDAVFYELRVPSFCDGDGDGVGDFEGLRSKLGYLEALGVDALWLLPFYPSPGRDDGYDVADYLQLRPELGTLDHFRSFVEQAHERGLRVLIDLVLNHTSDQHPWFQRARRSPPGSSDRARYVFGDDPRRYAEARVLFPDFESSNWTWDDEARAYYWHRFFAHQPDLNFDDPGTQTAMLKVVDHWLGLGVDGLRLDAVPYLFEREGTPCESLPETHAFVRSLRRHIDERFPGCVLLAEANQSPDRTAAYFGHADECQLAFHFPLMPKLFLALHQQDAAPIVEALSTTPEPPPGCQWATFLRNHDELSLEMVPPMERELLLRAYAPEASMRLNLGIRRRLAPLLGGQRAKVELALLLLLSLPGAPVLYYGDEIGMGEDLELPDRQGVRTPMQWSSGAGAGFSVASEAAFELPLVSAPGYAPRRVNVESQEHDPGSLLRWTRESLRLRRAHPALRRGALKWWSSTSSSCLAFSRQHGADEVLTLCNLASEPRRTTLLGPGAEPRTFIDLRTEQVLSTANSSNPSAARIELELPAHAARWLRRVDRP